MNLSCTHGTLICLGSGNLGGLGKKGVGLIGGDAASIGGGVGKKPLGEVETGLV